MQRVEGVEELFLDTFLAFDELDVVDQQDVDVAVTALERGLAVVAQQLMKSLVNSSVETYFTRMPGKRRWA